MYLNRHCTVRLLIVNALLMVKSLPAYPEKVRSVRAQISLIL